MIRIKDVKIDKKEIEPKEQLMRHKIVAKIKSDAHLTTFIKKNKLTDQDIENNLTYLLSYLYKIEQCENCQSLSECKQNIRGKEPVLEYENGDINLTYQFCQYRMLQNEQDEKDFALHLLGINPRMFENIDLIINVARKEILSKLSKYISAFPKKKQKGLYLYGQYGSGKTYLLADLTNKLIAKKSEVHFIYYPDFVRKIKTAIGTDDFEPQIEALKKAEVLILDDLGGETNTAFIRDEVLGPILQDRMSFMRPTFITSNLGEEQLFNHFSETSKDTDHLKAQRIIERIKTLMDFVELKDKNYRNLN